MKNCCQNTFSKWVITFNGKISPVDKQLKYVKTIPDQKKKKQE